MQTTESLKKLDQLAQKANVKLIGTGYKIMHTSGFLHVHQFVRLKEKAEWHYVHPIESEDVLGVVNQLRLLNGLPEIDELN